VRWSFCALTTSVTIDCALPALAPQLEALFDTFPAAEDDAQLHYDIACAGADYRLLRNDTEVFRCADVAAMAPALELDLYRQIPRMGAGAWVLHAAGLCVDDVAIVLVGPSGAGKTTVTRAALDSGWSYLSEEMCAIGRDLAVVGLRRPLHGNAAGVDYPLPTANGGITTRQLWSPPADRLALRARLATLVVLGYQPDAPTRAIPLSAGDALARAWKQTLDVRPWALATATEVLAQVPAVALSARNQSEAVAALDALATYPS